VTLILDEQARTAIAGELDALDRRMRELAAESRQRLDRGHGAPVATMAVLLLFERASGSQIGPTVL
jgi:hypothetical protein